MKKYCRKQCRSTGYFLKPQSSEALESSCYALLGIALGEKETTKAIIGQLIPLTSNVFKHEILNHGPVTGLKFTEAIASPWRTGE